MEDVGIFGLFDGHLAIFYGFLLYFIVIWCIIPVWVSFCKKNLATLLSAAAREREKKKTWPQPERHASGSFIFCARDGQSNRSDRQGCQILLGPIIPKWEKYND
jgi:hypothetical protein